MRKHLGLNKYSSSPSKLRMSIHQISAYPYNASKDDHTDAALTKHFCILQVVALKMHSVQKDKAKNAVH